MAHKLNQLRATQLLPAVWVFLIASTAIAQTITGSQALTFTGTDGNTIPYRLFTPPAAIGSQAKYPLVIFFHGSGEIGNDNISQTKYIGGLIAETASGPNAAYVVAPQCPPGQFWTAADWTNELIDTNPSGPSPSIEEPMFLSLELLDYVIANYNIDTSRIYVTGLSMGGYGVYDALARRPQFFAAAAPMSGAGVMSTAQAIAHVPIWDFQGADDTNVDPHYSEATLQAITQAGGAPRFTLLPGEAHEIWQPLYDNDTVAFNNPYSSSAVTGTDALYDWLFAQRLGQQIVQTGEFGVPAPGIAAGSTNYIADSSFESPTLGSTQLTPGGSPWVFSGNSGIAVRGGANPPLPNGLQAGYLDVGLGTQISQQVILPAGQYVVSFNAWQPAFPAGNQGTSFSITLAGQLLGYYQPQNGPIFTAFTTPTATIVQAGTYPLVFTSLSTADSNPVWIDTVSLVSTSASGVAVPNLFGDTESQASGALTQSGLQLGNVTSQSSSMPTGEVISQSPQSGASVSPNTSISVVLSAGAGSSIPNVIGSVEPYATVSVLASGFTVGTVTTSSSGATPAGEVMSQSPAPGSQAAPGTPVNLLVSTGLPTPNAGVVQINGGSGPIGSWAGDEDFNGGWSAAFSMPIDTSRVVNPAPVAVYQSEHVGPMTYTIPNLAPGGLYEVNLHFAEIFWTGTGLRRFNVSINGAPVLRDFDIFAAAGGLNIALIERFPAVANGNGQIVIAFTLGSADLPKVSGIEIVPATVVSQINAGSGAVGTWTGDELFNGGWSASTPSPVDTTRVSYAAPAAVYQSEHVGPMTYTIPNLVPGASYGVQLHFAEFYWTNSGMRKFNVSINGAQVLNDFDIFAAAGGQNVAVVEEFQATANANGQIVIDFALGSADLPKVSGIEIDSLN